MKMTRFKDEHHAEVTSWSSCLPACRCAGVADHLHADAGRRRRNTKAAAAACRGRRASSPAEPLFFGSLSFAFSHQTVLLSFIYTKEVSHVGTATVWHRSAIQDEALTVAQICIVSSVHNHPPTTTTTFPSAPPPPAEPASPVREPPPVYTLHTTFCTDQSGAGAGRQTWKAHSYNRGSIGLAPSRRRPGRPARGGGAVGHPLKCGGMAPEEGPHKQQPRPRYPPPPPTEAHHSVQSLCWKLRRSGGVMRSRDAAECLQAQVSEQAKGQTTHPPWPGPPIARCGPSSFSLKQWAEGFAWKVILHLGPAGMLVTMDTRGGWRWSLRLGPYLNTKACLDPPLTPLPPPKKTHKHRCQAGEALQTPLLISSSSLRRHAALRMNPQILTPPVGLSARVWTELHERWTCRGQVRWERKARVQGPAHLWLDSRIPREFLCPSCSYLSLTCRVEEEGGGLVPVEKKPKNVFKKKVFYFPPRAPPDSSPAHVLVRSIQCRTAVTPRGGGGRNRALPRE